MIAVKFVQSSLNPKGHTVFVIKRPSSSSFVSLCKSKDSNSEPDSSEGDASKQEMLARMAMLQAQKVRLTGYLDEASAQLTQFVEDANAEFEKIEEDALKGLDEASARVGIVISFCEYVLCIAFWVLQVCMKMSNGFYMECF